MKEDKEVVVCDTCFNSEKVSVKKEKYNCGKCGREESVLLATELANLAFSFGKGAINNGTVMAIIKNLKNPIKMINFHLKLNISGGGVAFDPIAVLEKTDFVSGENISSEVVYQQGLNVLKDLVDRYKKKFRENTDTGMDIDNRWISLILRSTFKNEFIKGHPQFGYIITQKLKPEYLGKKFLLYPEGVNKFSFHSPVMEEFKTDMINKGSVEAFKKMYDFYILGDMEVTLKKLENTRIECCVAEVVVEKTPAVLLIPEKRRTYIFHA